MNACIVPRIIKFVLKEGKSNNWFKDKGQDFVVEIPVNSAYEEKKKQFELEEEQKRIKEEEDRKARATLWTDALSQFRSQREVRKLDGNVAFKSFQLSDDIGEIDVVASFNEKDSIVDVSHNVDQTPNI